MSTAETDGPDRGENFGAEYIEFLERQTKGEGGAYLERTMLEPCLSRHWVGNGRAKGLKRVLEIGCGFGMNTLRLTKINPKPVAIDAIDLSPAMIEKGRKSIKDKSVTFHVMSGAELTFDAGVFDLATSAFVLENMPDSVVQASLREANRMLPVGGAYVIAMLHPMWLLLVSGKEKSRLRARGARYSANHLVVLERRGGSTYSRYYRSPETYAQWFRAAGFHTSNSEALCIPTQEADPELPDKYLEKVGLPVFSVTTLLKV